MLTFKFTFSLTSGYYKLYRWSNYDTFIDYNNLCTKDTKMYNLDTTLTLQ